MRGSAEKGKDPGQNIPLTVPRRIRTQTPHADVFRGPASKSARVFCRDRSRRRDPAGKREILSRRRVKMSRRNGTPPGISGVAVKLARLMLQPGRERLNNRTANKKGTEK